MSELGAINFLNSEARGHWVRLRTLLLLRWMAIGGQTAAVLVAYQLLGLDLQIGFCFLAISASVWFNIVAALVQPPNKRLAERDAMLSLLFDLAQLGALLMLTGGLSNPFAVLILAPVTISATVLTLRSTAILGATAIVAISLLAFFYRPLAFTGGQTLVPPPLYVVGMWTALGITVIFVAVYARRVALETFNMSQALTATQMALDREHRLSAIGGLAAAAAHELGTPLATIKLASSELIDELSDKPELLEDVQLIRKQTERCRDILAQLSKGGKDDSHVKHAPISTVIAEAAEPHRDRGKTLLISIDGEPLDQAGDDQPTIARAPELVHGLRNLIQNAVDFADSAIWVDVELGERHLRIAVGDDGPGYPDSVIDRLGDPYLTTRHKQNRTLRSGYQGMGLGLFIAKTLLERTGADIAFANGSEQPGARRRGTGLTASSRPTGAIVEAIWPVGRIVIPKSRSREALGDNPENSLDRY